MMATTVEHVEYVTIRLHILKRQRLLRLLELENL